MNTKKNYCIKKQKMVYFLLILVGILLSYSICIFVDNGLFEQLFFYNIKDSFMDFFNCLFGYKEGNPYISETPTNYPAMAVLFYKLIASGNQFDVKIVTPMELKLHQFPWIILMVYTILLLFICRVVLLYKVNLKNYERIVLELILILSYPVMYAIERGNIINVAFVLTLFFVAYYNDDNKIFRILAYIALSLAAALKIYPAVFGLILVKEKKIGEAIKLVIYGFIFMVIPFFYFGGIPAIQVWIQGLIGFTNTFAGSAQTTLEMQYGYGYNYCLKNIFRVFSYLINGDPAIGAWENVAIVIYVLVIMAAFFTKHKWKELLCYAMLIVIVPAVSYTYALLFLIIPFLVYINSLRGNGKKREKESVEAFIYAVIMAIILIPWPFPYIEKCNILLENGLGPLPFQSLVGFICICLLIIMIIIGLFKDIYVIFMKNYKIKSEHGFIYGT